MNPMGVLMMNFVRVLMIFLLSAVFFMLFCMVVVADCIIPCKSRSLEVVDGLGFVRKLCC